MRSRSIGPQQNRACIVTLSDEETARVRRFVKTKCLTLDEAKKRLGVGDSTLEAARDFGRMQRATRVRLLEALAREEGVT